MRKYVKGRGAGRLGWVKMTSKLQEITVGTGALGLHGGQETGGWSGAVSLSRRNALSHGGRALSLGLKGRCGEIGCWGRSEYWRCLGQLKRECQEGEPIQVWKPPR